MEHSEGKQAEAIIDAAEWATAEMAARMGENKELSSTLGTGSASVPNIRLTGVQGRDGLLMGIDVPWVVNVDGPLGDYAFAFNRQASFKVEGTVGDGVAEGMISGAVRVRGDCGVGAGTSMTGGTLAVYGRAGAYCGAAMRGGELFVRGDVGPAAAAGALGGTLVIGGDAGEGLGDSMRHATIFIRGKVLSLGRGVREAPLREREKLRLGLLLINAGIRGEAKDFRRIVSDIALREETKKPRGEVSPSWK